MKRERAESAGAVPVQDRKIIGRRGRSTVW